MCVKASNEFIYVSCYVAVIVSKPYVCVSVYMCIYVCVYMCVCILVYVSIYVCVCVYICIYVCMCMYVCVYICDCTCEKGPCRASFQNRVITTIRKSRLSAIKYTTYLVMKVKCSGVIVISVHSFLLTAIG